jgi:hypothetical protein
LPSQRLGTSLAAMVPPLIMSSMFHRKVGNVASPNILLPLIVGSGMSKYLFISQF